MTSFQPAPGVLIGYRALCIGTALFMVATGIGMQFFTGFMPTLLADIPNEAERSRQLAEWDRLAPMMTLTVAYCYGLAIMYGLGVFIPRKFWGWVIGIVLIGLALTTCALPFAIWVGILWLKPEVRTWFEGPTAGQVRETFPPPVSGE